MIIGNVKSQGDLAKKKSVAKDLLEIEIANEAENQKRVRNYKSTYQAKAVPAVYKTPSELRADKDRLLRDAREKLQSLGIDYSIVQSVIANYLNGSVDLLVKFNALFPSIKNSFTRSINPTFASAESVTDLIRQVMESSRIAFGFSAPSADAFQNLETAREEYDIAQELTELRGSDSMAEILGDESLRERGERFLRTVDALLLALPREVDYNDVDGMPAIERKAFYTRLGDLFSAQKIPMATAIQNLMRATASSSDSDTLRRFEEQFRSSQPESFKRLLAETRVKEAKVERKRDDLEDEAIEAGLLGFDEALAQVQAEEQKPFERLELTPEIAIEDAARKFKPEYRGLSHLDKEIILKLVETGDTSDPAAQRMFELSEQYEEGFERRFDSIIVPIILAARKKLGLADGEAYGEESEEEASPAEYKPEVFAQEYKEAPRYAPTGFLALNPEEPAEPKDYIYPAYVLASLDDTQKRTLVRKEKKAQALYDHYQPLERNIAGYAEEIERNYPIFDARRLLKGLQKEYADELKGRWREVTRDTDYFAESYPARGSAAEVVNAYAALKSLVKAFYDSALLRDTGVTFESLFGLPAAAAAAAAAEEESEEEGRRRSSSFAEEVPPPPELAPKKRGRPKKFTEAPTEEQEAARAQLLADKERLKTGRAETKQGEIKARFEDRRGIARQQFQAFKDELEQRYQDSPEEATQIVKVLYSQIFDTLVESIELIKNADPAIEDDLRTFDAWVRSGTEIDGELADLFFKLAGFYFLIANGVDMENYENPLPDAYRRTAAERLKGGIRKVKGGVKIEPLRTGLGLKEKEGLIKSQVAQPQKEFVARRIKVGGGISPPDEPTYRQFGKYVIHMPYLHNNTANFKYPSLGAIPTIKPTPISDDYKELLLQTLKTGALVEKDLRRLEPKEIKHFEKVVSGAGLLAHFKLNKSPDDEVDDLKRFELLRGEYNAGNNAPTLIKELRALVTKFMDNGRVKRKEGEGFLKSL